MRTGKRGGGIHGKQKEYSCTSTKTLICLPCLTLVVDVLEGRTGIEFSSHTCICWCTWMCLTGSSCTLDSKGTPITVRPGMTVPSYSPPSRKYMLYSNTSCCHESSNNMREMSRSSYLRDVHLQGDRTDRSPAIVPCPTHHICLVYCH